MAKHIADRIILTTVCLISFAAASARALAQNPTPTVAPAPKSRVIFDTDFQTDVDDVGALALLHTLADRGETRILATMYSSLHPWGARAIDAVNTYYGRGDLPIGVLKGPGVNMPSKYTQYLASNFPQDLGTNPPDAVTLYRQILAGQDDHSVTIVTLGYATNLRNLLASGPDQASALTGPELIARKVDKWVNMGGNFETREGINTTNVNWQRDAAAAVTAINTWPTEIVFAGREIGHSMRAGARLTQTPADNIVRVAYEQYFGGTAKDHHLADLVPVFYAVRGLQYDTGHGIEKYWNQESGQITMNPDATFTWTPGASGPHKQSRLIDAKSPGQANAGLLSPAELQERIEDLMIAGPAARASGPGPANPQPAH